jgi:P-type conjugative transfer protein TrbJ
MRKKILVLLVCLLLLAPSVSSASGIPVVDILAWIQRAYAQIQRAEQIYHQVEQVYYTVKSLESYGQGGSWSSLHGLLGELDQIFNTYSELSGNLGYLKIGVEQVYRDTFPGTTLPAGNWPDQYKTLLDRSHETLALLLAGQNRLTWNNTASQIRLAEMTAASLAADSPMKEAEVNNMFHSLETTELQKGTQATLLAANASTLSTALELQRQATAAAARKSWFDAGAGRPVPGYDPSPGYTGLPSSTSGSFF